MITDNGCFLFQTFAMKHIITLNFQLSTLNVKKQLSTLFLNILP